MIVRRHRWLPWALLALSCAAPAHADEGLHAQLLLGFDSFVVHDPLPVRRGAIHAGAGAFGPAAPPMELHVGASILPRFGLDLALGLRWAALDEDPDVVRHDADVWLAARTWPWTAAAPVAPFFDLGGGVSSRSLTRESCMVACPDRGAELPRITRALLVAGVGAEWYPGSSGAHLVTRLDARVALPADRVGTDVRLTYAVGFGWRWR